MPGPMNNLGYITSLLLMLLLSACSPDPATVSDYTAEAVNPLPECPDTPNCFRATLRYPMPHDNLLAKTVSTLEEMEATNIVVTDDSLGINSVFTIALFGYKDDFDIRLVPDSSDTYLHTRSASREGKWDIGVNKDRTIEFIRTLESNLFNQ